MRHDDSVRFEPSQLGEQALAEDPRFEVAYFNDGFRVKRCGVAHADLGDEVTYVDPVQTPQSLAYLAMPVGEAPKSELARFQAMPEMARHEKAVNAFVPEAIFAVDKRQELGVLG